MFFNDWESVIRTVVMAVLAYIGLVAVLRISGKRTLSKMNAFDFVITVALGSSLATIILSKDIALAEGIVALAMLVAMQWCVTSLSASVPKFERLVKNEPTLLAYNGTFLRESMSKERISEEEITQALRAHGYASLSDVRAVVLETNGEFSVINVDAKSPEILNKFEREQDWRRAS